MSQEISRRSVLVGVPAAIVGGTAWIGTAHTPAQLSMTGTVAYLRQSSIKGVLCFNPDDFETWLKTWHGNLLRVDVGAAGERVLDRLFPPGAPITVNLVWRTDLDGPVPPFWWPVEVIAAGTRLPLIGLFDGLYD